MWYTDDVGKTWAASNTLMKKMDEAQLVELGDGIVMANMRNAHLNVRFIDEMHRRERIERWPFRRTAEHLSERLDSTRR